MGTCASAPSKGLEHNGRPSAQNEHPVTFASPSRQHLIASPESGKCSTADTIAAAFVAQAASEVSSDLTKALTTRLTSRKEVSENRRASAQASQLGIGPAPAAESLSGFHCGGHPRKLGDSQGNPERAEDFFEAARSETARRLDALQKSFRRGAGTAWRSAQPQRGDSEEDAGDSDLDLDLDGDRGRGGGGGSAAFQRTGSRRGASGPGMNVFGRDPGGGGDGAEGALDGDLREEEGEVVVISGDADADDKRSGMEEGELRAVHRAAAGGGGSGADGGELGLDEGCGSPRRLEHSAASAVHVRQIAKEQGSASAAAAGAGGGAVARSCDPETDELTSLPLPNLVSSDGNGYGNGYGNRLRVGQRYSEASYLTQQQQQQQSGNLRGAMEGRVSSRADRNSDLGYYLEESRFASVSSPPRGALPVRHHMLESALARQRAEQAAKEAEAARTSVQVLDYVPAIRFQPSRGNLLLAQPSKKVRQQSVGRACDRTAGDIEVDSEEDSGGASRGLEYHPTKSSSRKQAQLPPSSGFSSGLVPLLASPSRLASPSSGSILGPTSPPAAGSALRHGLVCESSTCFYVTTPRGAHDAGTLRAATASGSLPAAASSGMPATASGSLPVAASGSLFATASGVGPAAVAAVAAATSTAMPVALATPPVTANAAAAASLHAASTAVAPSTPKRKSKRRDGVDPRVTSSASLVHFGPVEMLAAPVSPRHPPALTCTVSSDLSLRSRRSPGLAMGLPAGGPGPRQAEHRPSAPLLRLANSRLQHHRQAESDGVYGGGGGESGLGGRRRAPEVLSSSAWSESSPPLKMGASWAGEDGGGGGGVLGSGTEAPGSRVATRAARLLASLHRLGMVTPEQQSTAA